MRIFLVLVLFLTLIACEKKASEQHVSVAKEPVRMARAFADATQAGRLAFEATPMTTRQTAQASTPTVGQPFWHTS